MLETCLESTTHLQDLPEQPHVLVQKDEAWLEVVHAAQHQGVVDVVLGLCTGRPPTPQQLSGLLPVMRNLVVS